SDKKATSEDRRLFNLGVHEYRMRLEQEPWSFFPFIIHKFARLWYGLDTGIFYQQFFLGLCSLVIMPIAIYQIWLWRIDHLYLSLIIGLLFLYLTILYLISLPLFRYIVPLYPFLIFSASHQYLKLFKVLRTHIFERFSLNLSRFVTKGQAV